MTGRGALASGLALGWILAGAAVAQVQPPPSGGTAALELVLRRLGTTATVMITNAHPDDEDSALIAMLAHGLGVRVVEATATRGEGGQNDLGPELGLPLSVLRTEELLATHRIDGAEQAFARAIDFGYSFCVDETYEKWGKEEILADYVRLIRMHRPDVIISMSPDGKGGGQHHQASARITREAFDAAADPARFPEQVAEGLRPWQALRLYVPLPAPPRGDSRPSSRPESEPARRPGDVVVDTDVYDPALGATYHEIGTLARGMHKTQGMARLGALPGPAVRRFRLAAVGEPGPNERHSGSAARRRSPSPARAAARLLPSSSGNVSSLGRFAAGPGDSWNGRALRKIDEAVEDARWLTQRSKAGAALDALVVGLKATRTVRSQFPESSAFGRELEFHLARKERELLDAIAIAAGLRIDALADDGVVVPGQEIGVTVHVANRAGADLTFEGISFAGFEPAEGGCATRPAGGLASGDVVTCESRLRVPKDARFTTAHWRPLPGAARNQFDPDVPFGAPFRPSPFRARIRLRQGGVPLEYDVAVEFRDGSDPFAGEKRHELLVVPPEGSNVEVMRLEYPHTRRRHLVPAPPRAKRPADVEIALPLRVGYVPSVCDCVPEAMRDLGAQVDVLDERALRGGDLAAYDAIVVGARALELSPGFRRQGRALSRYVESGGTVIVLYHRSGLTEATCAPFPGKTGGARTTDEAAPVRVLVPDHPVFTTPNRLEPSDWEGWVGERGRSYFETKDERYVDLVETEDPFAFNEGTRRGVLVEARIGKGRWIYVGLSLSRQLEAGVPGGYRLLANLLSLGAGSRK